MRERESLASQLQLRGSPQHNLERVNWSIDIVRVIMSIAESCLTNINYSIPSHIECACCCEVLDVLAWSFGDGYIVSSNSLYYWYQSSIGTFQFRTPLNLDVFHESTIGLEGVMPFVCVVMRTKIQGDVDFEHSLEETAHLLMFGLAVFDLTVTPERVVWTSYREHFWLVRFVQNCLIRRVWFVLWLLVVQNLVRIEQYEIEQWKFEAGHSTFGHVVSLERCAKNAQVIITMLVIAWVDYEWPMSGDLGDHIKKIFIVSPVIGLQIVCDIAIDKDSFNASVGFNKIVKGVVERPVSCAKLSKIAPISQWHHFELIILFREGIGNGSVDIRNLWVRGFACPAEHHIADVFSFFQINNRAPMHVGCVIIEGKLCAVAIDLLDAWSSLYDGDIRFLAAEVGVESNG